MRLQITNAKSQSNIGKVIDLNSPAIIDGRQSKYTVIFKGKEHVLRVYLDSVDERGDHMAWIEKADSKIASSIWLHVKKI